MRESLFPYLRGVLKSINRRKPRRGAGVQRQVVRLAHSQPIEFLVVWASEVSRLACALVS